MSWFDKAGSFLKDPKNLGLTLANPFWGAQAFAGKTVNDNWREAAYPERTADDYNAPWETQLSEELVPSADNPMVERWTQGRMGAVAGAGGNEAAQAAAGQRARVGGFLELARLSPEYWDRLMRQTLALRRAREGIQTTSPEIAFLQGVGGAGGFTQAGQLGGNLYRPKTGG